MYLNPPTASSIVPMTRRQRHEQLLVPPCIINGKGEEDTSKVLAKPVDSLPGAVRSISLAHLKCLLLGLQRRRSRKRKRGGTELIAASQLEPVAFPLAGRCGRPRVAVAVGCGSRPWSVAMAIGDSAPAPLIARYSAPVAALAAAAALVAPRFSLLQEAEARLPLSAFPAVPPAVLIAACALREELQLDFFANARVQLQPAFLVADLKKEGAKGREEGRANAREKRAVAEPAALS